MNTITTKYLPPTTHKGARIVATTASGIRKTISYSYELGDNFECHAEAVHALNEVLHWQGEMVAGGAFKGDGYVFVFTTDNKIVLEATK